MSIELEMVKRNGYNIRGIVEQTHEMCLVAVKGAGLALQFVKEQTEDICSAAVNSCGLALRYVINQTPEICLDAVKQDGWALEYVINQTPEMCMEAVKHDGIVLVYVKEQTEEICLAAISENKDALKYVKNITKEFYKKAMLLHPAILVEVPDKYLSMKDEYYYLDGLEDIRLYKCSKRRVVIDLRNKSNILYSTGCKENMTRTKFRYEIYTNNGGFNLKKGINPHRREYLSILAQY